MRKDHNLNEEGEQSVIDRSPLFSYVDFKLIDLMIEKRRQSVKIVPLFFLFNTDSTEKIKKKE